MPFLHLFLYFIFFEDSYYACGIGVFDFVFYSSKGSIPIFLFLLLLVYFDYEEDDVHGGDIREIVELMKHGSDNGDVMKLNERIKPLTTNFNQQV